MFIKENLKNENPKSQSEQKKINKESGETSKSAEEASGSKVTSTGSELTLEVRPSLAGNLLHAYRVVVQCGALKIREYSKAQTENLRWLFPEGTVPDRTVFSFPRNDEGTNGKGQSGEGISANRCGTNFSVFVGMVRRNQPENNIWVRNSSEGGGERGNYINCLQ